MARLQVALRSFRIQNDYLYIWALTVNSIRLVRIFHLNSLAALAWELLVSPHKL